MKWKVDHGIEIKSAIPKQDPYVAEAIKPWRNMILVKRYPHHTLFYRRTQHGTGWHECFLNREVDGLVNISHYKEIDNENMYKG